MTPELSHPLALGDIGEDEVVVEITADANQRRRLAARFDLVAVAAIEAVLRVHRAPAGRLLVRGRITAEVVQRCVVSLEPVAARIEAEVARTYAGGRAAAAGPEVVVEALAGEIVEALPAGALDLGEVVAEELGLAIDPYPRKPGASLAEAPAPAASPPSPFAVLARLRRQG